MSHYHPYPYYGWCGSFVIYGNAGWPSFSYMLLPGTWKDD